ncbi:serine hydrolase domain-containing protein [Paludisphaera mucosa]|uniref:Serine hydrolase n=1 Tax=Paludisphaera mucosa TaxID=3030827 RepID=A0ABT6F486_9BACT|nr:serine hydrolase domain-containing protein [Paludisphaera mucosa]MDG3002339.1 serine hydrolase [Paludisphaera mucosa]
MKTTKGRSSRRRIPSFEAVEARRLMTTVPGGASGLVAAASHGRPAGMRQGGATQVEVQALRTPAGARGRLSPEVVRALDAEIDRAVAQDGLPSAAVMITIPGSRSYVAVRGEADLRTGRARGAAMPFRIASITKSFTATAVLQLADRGKLSLDDPLAKWYPDFPHADSITVDDLLRMRSGIPDSLGHDLLGEYYADPLIRITPQESIDKAASMAHDFQPADRETVYNNLNYIFLQEIVARVAGRDLGAQIRRSILRPLGLTTTSYPTGDRLPGPLRGYSLDAEAGRPVDKTVLNPAVAGGAGAMISTLRDLTVYARALGTGTLLKPETQAARLQGETLAGAPDFVKYGEGVEMIGPFVGHNGTIFGFSSEMFYLPALRATIVVDVNRLDVDDVSRSTPLFLSLARIAFPEYVLW